VNKDLQNRFLGIVAAVC